MDSKKTVSVSFDLPLYFKTEAGTLGIVIEPTKVWVIQPDDGQIEECSTAYINKVYKFEKNLLKEEFINEANNLSMKLSKNLEALNYLINEVTK